MGDCRTFPLKQGDLDYLCSIYAAINLWHLRDAMFDVSAADKLFRTLISEQLPPLKWNIGKYVSEGVDPNSDIVELFEAAQFSSVEAISPSFETIAAECSKQSGVLIYIEETTGGCDRFTHCTIATGVTRSGDVELYDSWKFKRLKRANGELTAGNYKVQIVKAWRVS